MPPSPSFSVSVYWPRRRWRWTLVRRRNVTIETSVDRTIPSSAHMNDQATAPPWEIGLTAAAPYMTYAMAGTGRADSAEMIAVRRGGLGTVAARYSRIAFAIRSASISGRHATGMLAV